MLTEFTVLVPGSTTLVGALLDLVRFPSGLIGALSFVIVVFESNV